MDDPKYILLEWLRRFGRYTSSLTGLNCLILLYNCLPNGGCYTIPELPHLKVMFLPPNETSQVQPLDDEIIASIKAVYKSKLMTLVIDNIDVSAKNIYNIDVLMGLPWISLP